MRVQDLDPVMEIERLCFPDPWTPGLFLHELKLPFSTTMLARQGTQGTIWGYVCWWFVAGEVHLLNIAVHPDRQGTGLGKALLQLVFDDATTKRAESVTLEVRADNQRAITMYEKLGFEHRGLRRHYYGRGEHAVIMTRLLRAP